MSKNKKEITANWTGYEKRPAWATVTSRELSQILGVSLQTINNWKMREFLPEPEPFDLYKGNKNRYRISKIRAWLEGVSEDKIEIAWVREFMDYTPPIEKLEDAYELTRKYPRVFEMEQPIR